MFHKATSEAEDPLIFREYKMKNANWNNGTSHLSVSFRNDPKALRKSKEKATAVRSEVKLLQIRMTFHFTLQFVWPIPEEQPNPWQMDIGKTK